ncbi:restriction endonuclease [Ornithinimicrobium cavernae]|uniref:restriction endonuclease n=1 Tax=Ornithinimicrobium cavernae TaxID=2666047 RepID=UPI000D69F011|nr:restriction endonuclease [Ornithinimicrobium cavernae]
MLDFSELGAAGRGLEQLVREVLIQVGYNPQWSGQGPDGGRDLTFVEQGDAILGRKQRRWLVSCKDNVEAGRAVGADAADGMLEVLEQHNCQAFLLVCTTHPSAALVTRLTEIEARRLGRVAAHVWDGVTLERLLTTPRGWAVAQQFMPVSSEAAGWKIFATDSPNQWRAAHRGFYFHLSARTAGGVRAYELESLDEHLDTIAAVAAIFDVRIRLRAIWHNDTKGGGYVWFLDCFPPHGEAAPDAADMLNALGDGYAHGDGQFHSFEITPREVSLSDHFDYDHYSFYDDLPGYI